MDNLIIIIDVAEPASIASSGHLLVELPVLVLEVVLRSIGQLVVVVHVYGAIDFLVIDVRGNMPKRILLVNIFLAPVVVVAYVRLVHVGPLGGQHLILTGVGCRGLVSSHCSLLLCVRAKHCIFVLLLEGDVRGGISWWAIVEESHDLFLAEEDFNYSLSLFLIKLQLTTAGSIDLMTRNIGRRVNVIQGRQIKFGALPLRLVLLLRLLHLLLFLFKHLINCFLQVVLQLGFRGQFSLELDARALVLLSDIIDHLLQLVNDPLVPLSHLFLRFCLFLRVINQWISRSCLVWHRWQAIGAYIIRLGSTCKLHLAAHFNKLVLALLGRIGSITSLINILYKRLYINRLFIQLLLLNNLPELCHLLLQFRILLFLHD